MSLSVGGLTFASVIGLAVLILIVPAVAVLVARAQRRRRRDLLRFGDPALLERTTVLPSRAWRIARDALAIAALTLLGVALARPQWGATEDAERSTGPDVWFLLDLSRSMLADDVSPSRLDAAREAASTIARAVPTARVGLLVFGGTGFLQLAPTANHATFERFLEGASPETFPDPSTNLEAAADVVHAAVLRAGDSTGVPLVILSDGEDVEGKLMKSIDAFRAARVRVFAVGLGTREGTTIPERDSTGAMVPHRDGAGRVVITHLAEDNLQDIARLTGGRYVRWSGVASVAPIARAVARAPGARRASTSASPAVERFQLPLAVALLALVAEGALPDRARRRR